MEGPAQAEHQHISTSLEVETLENNLFRSKSLWLPKNARGVFGGQVISQALVSATNCVDRAFGLHSLHCYFLLSASSAVPIVYQVERVRQGRSYVTTAVKAIQHGKIIFIALCSFQKPEPWQPIKQKHMPEVPDPDQCVLEEVVFAQRALEKSDERWKQYWEEAAHERSHSTVAVKLARQVTSPDECETVEMYWMQAKHIPKYDAAFQKCILAYISDLYFLGRAPFIYGLKRYPKGPNAVAMTSTVDHTVHYYSDDFDCGEWLLFVMTSPRAASGRGLMRGEIYSRSGNLIAVITQEGVVRTYQQDPNRTSTIEKAKL